MSRTASEIATDLRQRAQKMLWLADTLDPPQERESVVRRPSEASRKRARPGALAELETPAPYGYKADGTPRKRPAPTRETQTRAHAAKAQRRAENARAGGQTKRRRETRLRVLSSTAPTEAELKDREIKHVTAEPA